MFHSLEMALLPHSLTCAFHLLRIVDVSLNLPLAALQIEVQSFDRDKAVWFILEAASSWTEPYDSLRAGFPHLVAFSIDGCGTMRGNTI